MRIDKLVPLVILALSAVTMEVYLLPEVPILRPLVMLAFLAIGPGLAIGHFLRLPGLALELTVGMGLSLALDIGLVLIFLYTRTWSVPWMLTVLLIISISCSLVQLLRQEPPAITRGATTGPLYGSGAVAPEITGTNRQPLAATYTPPVTLSSRAGQPLQTLAAGDAVEALLPGQLKKYHYLKRKDSAD
ncbi:MAG: hypothetical protein J0I20_25640 [Chloroflexi bacterium]|nr:hypothetical protein [Chloroflexota bacterium]OJW01839.1 MAG: hypothetical protein BGO39_28215 [Chloroflexi bacterium 54-19]